MQVNSSEWLEHHAGWDQNLETMTVPPPPHPQGLLLRCLGCPVVTFVGCLSRPFVNDPTLLILLMPYLNPVAGIQ